MKFAIAVIGSLLLTACLGGGGGGGNTAPVATADTYSVEVNATVSQLDVLANDTDADGDALSIKAGSVTAPDNGGTADINGTQIDYTPAAGFNGIETFAYTVTDGTDDGNTVTVTVEVGCVASTATITHNGFDYKEVCSPYTGKKWLDRNLGAAQVCTSYNDTACYGDYYQWGRNFDGHEDSTSTSTTTLATQIDPVQPAVQGEFITNSSSPYDWTANTVDNNGSIRSAKWSQTDGSNVCPTGYRVPSEAELKAETTDEDVTNRATAFANFLKLPSAGYRNDFSGSLYGVGSWGNVWSASVDGSTSRFLSFGSGYAGWYNAARANGYSVRCLRD